MFFNDFSVKFFAFVISVQCHPYMLFTFLIDSRDYTAYSVFKQHQRLGIAYTRTTLFCYLESVALTELEIRLLPTFSTYIYIKHMCLYDSIDELLQS